MSLCRHINRGAVCVLYVRHLGRDPIEQNGARHIARIADEIDGEDVSVDVDARSIEPLDDEARAIIADVKPWDWGVR